MPGSTWAERGVRGSPRRLRNARELVAELSLVLEEMAGMGEDERQAAHEHHGHAVRLLESIGEELGPLGPDPAREQERIARMVRESMTTNGGRP